jgi:hypothetical protein
MVGSNSSPCSGQKSSRPSLRVTTSSSPAAAASTQNQVSSSMAPPPRPVVNGTWIQPYEMPANAPPANPHPLLANSGVSVLTDYPLSTSPRLSTREINRQLGLTGLSLREVNDIHGTPGRPRMNVGGPVGNFKSKVILTKPDFQSFSWDSTTQPRTAAARARGSNDNVSPGTKEPGESNKRKHSEISKE